MFLDSRFRIYSLGYIQLFKTRIQIFGLNMYLDFQLYRFLVLVSFYFFVAFHSCKCNTFFFFIRVLMFWFVQTLIILEDPCTV